MIATFHDVFYREVSTLMSESSKSKRDAQGTPTIKQVGVPWHFLLIGLDARMNCSKIKI